MSLPDGEIEVSPEQAQAALDRGEAQIVDVREEHEYTAGYVEGARHIEMLALTAQAASIDRDRPVIFQCRSGGRSLMAAQAFRQAGYTAYSMAGGLVQWSAEGRPMRPDDAVVADH
ncbi:MAG: rhodanese-like domain-containing protein [Solirubrobacteraceae bacterium]